MPGREMLMSLFGMVLNILRILETFPANAVTCILKSNTKTKKAMGQVSSKNMAVIALSTLDP